MDKYSYRDRMPYKSRFRSIERNLDKEIEYLHELQKRHFRITVMLCIIVTALFVYILVRT